MLKKLLYFFLLLSLISFIGCGSNRVENNPANPNINRNFSVPLKIGNYWEYDYRSEIDVTDTNGVIIDTNIAIGKIKYTITGNEVINNATWYKGIITGDSVIYDTNPGRPINKYCYFIEANNCLYNYNHSGDNSYPLQTFPMFAPEKSKTKIRWKGKEFNNIYELKHYLKLDLITDMDYKNLYSRNVISKVSVVNDTFIFTCLKYPITVGDSWVIRNNMDTDYIIKRYVEAFEFHTIDSQPIYCAKLKYNYYQ